MKTFKIVQTPTIICGTYLPFNSCYGSIVINYKHHYVATDKHGQKHHKFNWLSKKVVYYVDDYSVHFNALNIHIWDADKDRWIHTDTSAWEPYKRIYAYIMPRIEAAIEAGTISGRNDDVRPYVDGRWFARTKTADTDKDMLYKVRNLGYTLNPYVATDDVVSNKRRSMVTHTHHKVDY